MLFPKIHLTMSKIIMIDFWCAIILKPHQNNLLLYCCTVRIISQRASDNQLILRGKWSWVQINMRNVEPNKAKPVSIITRLLSVVNSWLYIVAPRSLSVTRVSVCVWGTYATVPQSDDNTIFQQIISWN